MKALGVDISYYQKGIDFDKLKNEAEFVILRIGYTGYGTAKNIQADTHFETFYKECKTRGIPVGAYYYSLATSEDEALRDSEFVLEKIRGKQFEYPIYWDTEEPNEMKTYHVTRPSTIGSDRLSAVGETFLHNIEKEGYYVGIYASAYWLKNQLDMNSLSHYDVWVANYGVDQPSYNGAFGMWQYTSTLRLSAFNGYIDGNYSYKDYPTIIKGANLNGYSKQDPVDLKAEIKECIDKLQSILDRM